MIEDRAAAGIAILALLMKFGEIVRHASAKLSKLAALGSSHMSAWFAASAKVFVPVMNSRYTGIT